MKLNILPHHKFFISLIIIALVGLVATMIIYPRIDTLGFAIFKAALGIIIFWKFDDLVMGDINTKQQLIKGNISYAIYSLGIAIIIAVCVATG